MDKSDIARSLSQFVGKVNGKNEPMHIPEEQLDTIINYLGLSSLMCISAEAQEWFDQQAHIAASRTWGQCYSGIIDDANYGLTVPHAGMMLHISDDIDLKMSDYTFTELLIIGLRDDTALLLGKGYARDFTGLTNVFMLRDQRINSSVKCRAVSVADIITYIRDYNAIKTPLPAGV